MATITATHLDAPDAGIGRQQRVRAALVRARHQAATAVSTARRRYRRPVLVVGSFASAVASAWTTFGLGAGLAATAIAGLALEYLGGEE